MDAHPPLGGQILILGDPECLWIKSKKKEQSLVAREGVAELHAVVDILTGQKIGFE